MSWKLAQYPMTVDDLFDAASRGWLYVVLDAADAPDVPAMMDSLGKRARALYSSRVDSMLRTAAPYLAKLDADLLAWIRETHWHDHWGILIESSADLTDVRRHLRHFLLVKDPQGRTLYFRFYDPRTIHTFLPNWNSEELAQFFGPSIDAFIARGPGLDDFTRYVIEHDTTGARNPYRVGHTSATRNLR